MSNSVKHKTDIEIINLMKSKSVLVVGDIMLDRFIYGDVNRISPESPIPILAIKRENMMLGGAGNTASNLLSLKCNAKIISIIGKDDNGANIKKLAKKQGVDISGLLETNMRSSIVKTRFLAGHQQLLRTDYEQIEFIEQELEKQLLDNAKNLLPTIDVMILSDYGKGVLTASLIKELIFMAKNKNIPILIDPKGTDYGKYAGADIITPNKKELMEATGLPVETDEQIIHAAKVIMQTNNIKSVIATRSQEGMSVIQQGKDAVHINSAADIEVFDVSGAGDSVIATLSASIASGADLVQAASLANISGSIVVSKVGTAPIHAEELKEALKQYDVSINTQKMRLERSREAPILNWISAKEEILRWKARGLKIGFTNGCFDILHLGHVSYLNDTRSKCDRLIVGLNSDSSVRILKGNDRPVHLEESRASVLSALGSVDMVIIFGAKKIDDDNTASKLLEILEPDIYFKGGDYKIEQIPEAPTVKSYGGIVDVMPVYDGHSTTNSIDKMKS